MEELSKEEKIKIIENVFEDAKTSLRSLKYDIKQDEFDKRLYQLNLIQRQICKLVEKKTLKQKKQKLEKKLT